MEDGEREGGFVTAQHFVVQEKRKSAKGRDGKNGEAAMDAHQFSVEWVSFARSAFQLSLRGT
jgi:hypothetical protein